MKKLFVLVTTALLIGMLAVPAMAVDHEFGGYWRTRFFSATNFSGDDSEAQDGRQVDMRTRLFYTAFFSDELKLVTGFEFNADFGDEDQGDIGADGDNFKVKHAYVDFTPEDVLEDWNFKIGTQPKIMARGFLFDDDFSGAIVGYVGDDMTIPFVWIKAYEGGYGEDADDLDFDYYGLDPVFTVGDFKLNPFGLYLSSAGGGDLTAENEWTAWGDVAGLDAISIYYVGANIDYQGEMISFWLTGIYSAGSVDVSDADAVGDEDFYLDYYGTDSFDVAAYLVAAGASLELDAVNLHTQFFYATGDDPGAEAYEDEEASAFFVPAGQSYYWAEIMGFGTFDDQVSAGAPGDQISNIMAVNLGLSYPMDRLTLRLDVWNANLVEEDEDGNTELGTEVDVTATYPLLDELTLKVVGAYLSAGDATGDEDPMEIGAQLHLRF